MIGRAREQLAFSQLYNSERGSDLRQRSEPKQTVVSEKILLISKIRETARILGGHVQEDTASVRLEREKYLEGQNLAKDV